MEKTHERFQDVLDLIRTLRGEGGCPWDRKQTRETLTTYVHQEFQELADALAIAAPEKIQEEMGDLLFMLLFMAELARDQGEFSIDDVFEQVKEKMIGRHPHIFGDVEAHEISQIKDNWKKIKAEEKLRASQQTLAEKMPRHLPVLQQALWVLRAAGSDVFGGSGPLELIERAEKRMANLRTDIHEGSQERVQHRIGELLFLLVGLSRLVDVHPEAALQDAVQQMLKRAENSKRA